MEDYSVRPTSRGIQSSIYFYSNASKGQAVRASLSYRTRSEGVVPVLTVSLKSIGVIHQFTEYFTLTHLDSCRPVRAWQ